MKIENIKTTLLSKPMGMKLVSSIVTIESIEFVLVEIASEGLTGIGITASFSRTQTDAMRKLISEYSQLLLGKPVEMVRGHWNDMHVLTNGVGGHTGLPVLAWAPLDIAMWDLIGKKANLPIYKLLGAHRNKVPVYISGGFLVPIESVIEEILEYKSLGYKAFKMRVGKPDYREDIKRVEAVKNAVGDDFEIMVDANQKWDVKRTRMVAPLLESLGVTYLEEPLQTQDYAGYAEVRNSTGIRIVAGESLFALPEHFQMMNCGGVDVLNPDLLRCGGITEYMQVCALANAFRIPVDSHTCTEINLQLMAAAPTGNMAEYLPSWWDGIFAEKMQIEDGVATVSDAPGLGLTFNPEALERYELDC